MRSEPLDGKGVKRASEHCGIAHSPGRSKGRRDTQTSFDSPPPLSGGGLILKEKMMLKPDAKQCVRSLNSTICPACGGTKNRAMSLCRRDYYKLPAAMRKAQYARVGSGYEEAMSEALHFLGAEIFCEAIG
jgi:hypothetical protein